MRTQEIGQILRARAHTHTHTAKLVVEIRRVDITKLAAALSRDVCYNTVGTTSMDWL